MKLLFDQNLSRKLVARLADIFPDSSHVQFQGLAETSCKILMSLGDQTAIQSAYVGSNLLNLFCHLKTDFKRFDFSHLVIQQAYLADVVLHEVDFTNPQLAKRSLQKPLAV